MSYDERRIAERMRADGYDLDEIEDRLNDLASDECDRLRDARMERLQANMLYEFSIVLAQIET